MNNLHFYGFHGILEAEKELGQKFTLSLELILDLAPSSTTDDFSKTVDYHSVFLVVKDLVENRRFNLVEALAESISAKIFEKYEQVQEVKVQVHKPEAPIRGYFDSFGVEIWRKR